MMKLDKEVMAEAKPHLDALKAICKDSGCSMEDLMESESPMEEEMEAPEMGEEEEGEGPDMGKVALIVAKMKKKDE